MPIHTDHVGLSESPCRLPILRYRSIPDASLRTALPGSVPVSRLEDQLAFLQLRGWKLVSLAEALRGSSSQEHPCVAVTFDGGLLDFLNAFKLLNSLGSRATLYIPVELVGLRVSRWDRGFSRLGWENLEELVGRGFEIGVQYTESGRFQALDLDNAVAERIYLEERLNYSIRTFCHTNRRRGFGSRHRHALAQAGYQTACTLQDRKAKSTDNPLSLPRIAVTPAMTGNYLHEVLSRDRSNFVPLAMKLPHQRVGRTPPDTTRIDNVGQLSMHPQPASGRPGQNS